jgi:tetratricopeptide (TPR) repeat protein
MRHLLTYFMLALLLSGCLVKCNKDHVAEGYEDLEQGNVMMAIDDFNWALGMESRNKEAYRGLATCYTQLEEYDKALENINAFLLASPYDASAYNQRGLLYLTRLEYEKAIVDFDRAIQLDATTGVADFNKAEALRFVERYEEAIEIYTKVIGLNKKDSQAYYKRGLAKYKNGNTTEACLDYAEASTLGNKDAKEEVKKSCK